MEYIIAKESAIKPDINDAGSVVVHEIKMIVGSDMIVLESNLCLSHAGIASVNYLNKIIKSALRRRRPFILFTIFYNIDNVLTYYVCKAIAL